MPGKPGEEPEESKKLKVKTNSKLKSGFPLSRE